MFGSFGWMELMLILTIVLIIFGAGKLPQLGELVQQVRIGETALQAGIWTWSVSTLQAFPRDEGLARASTIAAIVTRCGLAAKILGPSALDGKIAIADRKLPTTVVRSSAPSVAETVDPPG